MSEHEPNPEEREHESAAEGDLRVSREDQYRAEGDLREGGLEADEEGTPLPRE